MHTIALRSWVATLGLLTSFHVLALDAFDPVSTALSLDTVQVGDARYNNVLATVGFYTLLEVGSGAPGTDSYDATSQILTLGAVRYLGVTYNNVRVRLNAYSVQSATPVVTPPVVVPVSGAPHVSYTDIVSGPNNGGENGKGIYLSIFGTDFGSAGLGSTVKVFINNVEVDNYRYLGASKGRPDIQQITVQVGALGNPTPGTALPPQHGDRVIQSTR